MVSNYTGASNYKISYSVDLVFCIDCTGSMTGLLDMVKNNAITFYQDLTNAMTAKHKYIDPLRIRVVAFRDYLADGASNAMLTTDFFTLPDDAASFEAAVRSLHADGGGDDPEDGLEALAYAIRSKWNPSGTKRRQVIVVWTDAPTHPLGFAAKDPGYPNGMPKNLDELTTWWGTPERPGYVDSDAKRLLLFAPDQPAWNFLSDNWDNVLHYPSAAGNGLQELEYNQIINAICNTIGK